jgi:small-conductance mechanosensitive channel
MGCSMIGPARIGEYLRWLDALGFNVGAHRISIYNALMVVIVAAGVMVAGRLLNIAVRRTFRRMTRLDPAQQLLGEKVGAIVVWVGLILIGIDILGISLTALTVFSGAFGLAIGFGLQKTFGNLISGMILLADRSIKPGDVIAVGEGASRTVGQVNRIGIRAVSVITRDRIEYLIPNEHLMTTTVENWSFTDRDVRVKVPVSVAYGSDVDLAQQLMLVEARKLERVLDRHRVDAWLVGFGENAIQFEVQLWIDDPEEGVGNLRSDLLKGIFRAFQAHSIAIPYPQRDIHVKEWPSAPVAGLPGTNRDS